MHNSLILFILAIIPIIFSIGISPAFAPSHPEFNIDSPRQQMENGVSAEDVICNSGLTLMLKLSTGFSACVKPSTAIKLEDRGWGKILRESSMMEDESIYNPQIIPSAFISEINNKFFTLTPSTTFVYESETDEGLERIEVTVTDEKKIVMGVETTVLWDRVWLNDELIEDTKDWVAQDKQGNVWYFGENVDNYENGQLKDNAGSWEAGVDGAMPGFWMKANPQIGDVYRQEYYAGEAEDMAEVVALEKTVTVPYGTFSGCLKTKDWTPLDPAVIEFKYYCPEVGGLVLEENPEDEQIVELIEIKS